jgi:hypothetical protein
VDRRAPDLETLNFRQSREDVITIESVALNQLRGVVSIEWNITINEDLDGWTHQL